MNRKWTTLLIVMLTIGPLMGFWPMQAQAAYEFSVEGAGTPGSPGNPYLIKSAEDLDHVRDDLTASYKLQKDIDLSPYTSNWQPIGQMSDPDDFFRGHFDGDNYTIRGLTIDSSANYVGLFGYVRHPGVGTATITNVRLENVNIKSSKSTANIGGLVGLADASLNDRVIIDNVSVTGIIDTGSSGFSTGGIAGLLSYANISNSDAHVRITANGYAGGLVGYNSNGIIEQSYATGDVSVESGRAGGLVGASQSPIRNSYATGHVSGVSASIGGLSGEISSFIPIENSYSTSIVSKGSGGEAGGLIGRNNVGVGNPSLISGNYWNLDDNADLQTIGGTFGTIGTTGAISLSDLKQFDIVGAGWDPDIWGIQTGVSYPYLKSFAPVLKVDPLSFTYAAEPGYNQLTISGSVRDGSIGEPLQIKYIIVKDDDTSATVTQDVYDTVATGDNGFFSMTTIIDESSYPLGRYTIDVTVNDSVYGHEQLQTLSFDVVDKTAPAAPAITSPGNGQMINDTTPTVSGTSEAGATVTIVLDGTDAGTAVAAGDGSWTWTAASALTEGTHTLTARATDGAGNVGAHSSPYTFILDSTPPVITLNGSPTVQVEAGASYTDPGATADDRIYGSISGGITVTGSVYTHQIGTYLLEYDVSNLDGISASTVTRTVYVRDTQAPVISLLGDASIALTEGQLFVDPGATAIDGFEGNVPVAVTGTVDHLNPGTYLLRYNAQDSSGNVATEVTRTVRVDAGSDHSDTDTGTTPPTTGNVENLPASTGNPPDPAASPNCTFRDIKGHWAEADICEAAGLKIVEGMSANIFAPDKAVTRTEFAAMLLRTLQIPIIQQSEAYPYSDKDSIPEWARSTVHTGAVKGILHGYPDGTFRPLQGINRAEMAVMLAKALKWETNSEQSDLPFSDGASIPTWAQSYVKVVHANGLLQGRGGNQYVPRGMTTRAEAAAVMLRLWKSLEGHWQQSQANR